MEITNMRTRNDMHRMITKFNILEFKGPYGPQILALAEGWLASLTSCFATLNNMRGLRPLQFHLSCLSTLNFLGP